MYSPLPRSIGLLQCTIIKNTEGLTNKIYKEFRMIISNTGKFLMAGKKMQVMRSAHYLMTLEKEIMTADAPGYIGKLRSNFFGTEYAIYDNGENPNNGCKPDKARNQYGAIYFEEPSLGVSRPRQTHFLIPRVDNGKSRIQWKPLNDEQDIFCLLYTSPSPRDQRGSRMPSSA
eukprot:TRINITY_DN11277_c0_g1_i1.p1 TRINITY_DN11277_c0_g1~~TRINITY_DN11277_c0_g1_i1.p1  ORF type:complete len:173 (+),score=48.77 TRINITY_DN11277_c0_g1_i1:2-520(+)